jgi:hypothetical protein
MALWALVAVLGLIVVGMLKRIAPILERVEGSLSDAPSLVGLAVGAAVPSFEAEEIGAGVFTETDLHGSTAAVLFIGVSCQACERFVRDLEAGIAPELGARLVAVVADREVAASFAPSPALTVVFDERRLMAQAFESYLVPQTFVVDGDGIVLARGRPNDWEGMRLLLAHAKGGENLRDTAAAAVR